MKKKLHIIVTGEEGHSRTFVVCRAALRRLMTVSGAIAVILVVAGYLGIEYSLKNISLKTELGSLRRNLKQEQSRSQDFRQQVSQLEREKQEMMSGAVSDLQRKNQAIEKILGTIGVDMKRGGKTSKNGAGGPFTAAGTAELNMEPQELLVRVENNLNLIRRFPLGAPVGGEITSPYGFRKDPINGRPALHSGVDFGGDTGSPILSTASGRVLQAGHEDGYGLMVSLEHGNGFTTLYGHCRKLLVKKGDQVKRGQAVALLGSTGRSTGPHVHYEIHHYGKIMNPYRYLRVDRLLAPKGGKSS